MPDSASVAMGKGCDPSVDRPIDPSKFNSYEDLREELNKRVTEWLKRCGCQELDENRIEVIMIPNFGRYGKPYWTFGGFYGKNKPEPFSQAFSHVLLNALSKLIELDVNEVAIDLSHGLNFMLVAFKEAVELATELYSLLKNKGIKLTLYNSSPLPQPFPRNEKNDPVRLDVYEVVSNELEPRSVADKIALSFKSTVVKEQGKLSNLINFDSNLINPKSYNEIQKGPSLPGFTKLSDVAIASSNVFLYSFALAGAYLVRDLLDSDLEDEISKWVKRVLEAFYKHVGIDKQSREIKIPFVFKNLELILMLMGLSLTWYLVRNYSEKLGKEKVSKVAEEGLTVEDLKIIIGDDDKKIPGFLGSTYQDLGKNELKNLEEKCLKEEEHCEIEFSYCKWPNEKCEVGSLNNRHMKAHIGLERNVVEGNKNPCANELKIRYRRRTEENEDCWKKIFDHLSKVGY